MKIEKVYSAFTECSGVCIDTRKIIPDSMFIALKGDHFNANEFAIQALQSGCRYALVDDPKFCTDPRCLFVEDTLHALQEMAVFHRESLKIPFIAITGTNGKTTTKELMAAVLAKKYKVAFTKGNLNNHIGVPLTILSITDEEVALIEMGANHPGEIAALCKIAKPDLGLITNIGKAHLEGFGSLEGVVNTKKELYDWIQRRNGKLFVCSDSGLLKDLSENIGRCTYGVFPGSDCQGEILESNPLLKIKWIQDDKQTIISSNLFGFYNFENIMAAVCAGKYFGVEEEKIKEAIENYFPSNHRSQLINTGRNVVIMDAYNANPTSMQASINNFIHLQASGKIAVIGDMLELGAEAENEHLKILQLLSDAGFDEVLLVGKIFSTLNSNAAFHSFPDSEKAMIFLHSGEFSGKQFLIKGSRGIKLERVLEAL